MLCFCYAKTLSFFFASDPLVIINSRLLGWGAFTVFNLLSFLFSDPHSCELRWLYVQGRCAPDIYQAVSYVESATECMSQCLLNTSLSCGSVDYIANAQPSCFYRKERRTELKQVFVDVTNCHYFETWCPGRYGVTL